DGPLELPIRLAEKGARGGVIELVAGREDPQDVASHQARSLAGVDVSLATQNLGDPAFPGHLFDRFDDLGPELRDGVSDGELTQSLAVRSAVESLGLERNERNRRSLAGAPDRRDLTSRNRIENFHFDVGGGQRLGLTKDSDLIALLPKYDPRHAA